MRKICLVFLSLFLCIDGVDAAVRTQQNTITPTASRQATNNPRTNNIQTRSVSSRAATAQNTIRKTKPRNTSTKIVTGRNVTTTRSATRTSVQPSIVSRATIKNQTFGESYNSCRDAYFTCMDQFCALQNETYRRCVCSSKLQSIKKQEQTLAQTSDSLKNFEDLNIDTITKSASEVQSMLHESEGELGIKKDTSNSANTLKNISAVLNETKSQSLSTQGTLDIAGDIKSIWKTTDLIGGSDIANLTGEALYNAVHTQCYELVLPNCNETDLKMISSAYGIYIENDCSVLESNLKEKKTLANVAIRDMRHKMQDTRLENYDMHNSTSINDCIANVRKDITADAACGEGYVHCLDFSGKYLNLTTGEPIYSPDFFQIENQISLSGDLLKNSKNSAFINILNKKRDFAAQSLDLCRNDADAVWQEFLNQALVEIYQAQQERVQTVKKECLAVVNECYLKQSEQLKSFVGSDTDINPNQTLELSEEMCTDKLNTCSNLYGGGTSGLEVLVATMKGITDATIEQSCPELLNTFVQKLCAVSVNDSAHSAPYGCRTYAPGEARYARVETCNSTLINPFSQTNILLPGIASDDFSNYTGICSIDSNKIYTSCKKGYYLYEKNSCSSRAYCFNEHYATECRICPPTAICAGGTAAPETTTSNQELYNSCGTNYIGSLYQQLAIYALQNCTRPSDSSGVLSETLLTYVNETMNNTRTQLVVALSTECTNQSGIWVDVPWIDENGDGIHDSTGDTLFNNFYISTGASSLWGYCKK